MKPYYEHAGITIYHGDCREILPTLPKVDLVLTDPPYNVGIKYGQSVDDNRLDYALWCRSWWNQCFDNSGLVCVSPGIGNLHHWYMVVPKPDWVIAWLKPSAMGRCVVGFSNWEPCLVWGKPYGRGVDVVTAPIIPDPSIKDHPCPKPLKWATGLITQLTDQGSLLDPFMGSGTTLRAAKDLGRKAIGIEIEEKYCEIAARRLAQEVFAL